LKQGRIDLLAWCGHGAEPRDGLAATGDIDCIASLDAVDEFAQMCLGFSESDRILAIAPDYLDGHIHIARNGA
jgi:hypothetical protein